MNAFPILSSSITGIMVLGSFAALLISAILILDHRFNPLRKLAVFRVRKAPAVHFERLAHATIGDTPTRRAWFRYTLSFAFDADAVYLRHSRVVPFFPAFWRMPRKQIRSYRSDCWTVRIHAVDPPLNADFGPGFIAALQKNTPPVSAQNRR
jgi:hypothetical protein